MTELIVTMVPRVEIRCGTAALLVRGQRVLRQGGDRIPAGRGQVLHHRSRIPDDGWMTIRYPNAVFDQDLGGWVSDAEVAEVGFTAFSSRRTADRVTARLIVRRVPNANPDHFTRNAQGELFPVWRHHAVFTDAPRPLVDAEADHRRHAIIEQVIADLKNGPLRHLPSGSFAANSAWLVLAAIAFNLTRAVGALAGRFHARAVTATIRTQLINVDALITRSARRATLDYPLTGHGQPRGSRCSSPATTHRPRPDPTHQPSPA